MSDDAIIRVKNLSKRYVLGKGGARSEGLRHAIHDLATAPLRFLKQKTEAPKTEKLKSGNADVSVSKPEDFWALKDVNFEVKRGEVVGIIGRNGAGKSTLLKILSRITEPTTGRVEIDGRVASLLEVGTGFHPELTGRENIYLNGAILGMGRTEIRKKFDEIVAFAEVEKFLDTPVKRYSSGMYVRLAFAVAAHLEPEILIVDEVLAVGDAEFQRKCLGKMQDVSTGGRTVLFVSHNMNAIQMLCGKCLLLAGGQLTCFGPTEDIIPRYISSHAQLIITGKEYDLTEISRSGSGEARFVRFSVDSSQTDGEGGICSADPMEVNMVINSAVNQSIDSIGVTLFSRAGNKLLAADSLAIGKIFKFKKGLNRMRLKIQQLYLKPDTYVLALWLGQTGVHTIDFIQCAGELEVLKPRGKTYRKLPDDPPVYSEFTITCEQPDS
jgi:lipopolysaccharide transport system ATP-binding protein